MREIPKKYRNSMNAAPEMQQCIYSNSDCVAKLEWDHPLIFAGKQIIEPWATIPVCWFHHQGPGNNKHFRQMIALNRISDEVLRETYSKAADCMIQRRCYLNSLFLVREPVLLNIASS